MAPPPRRVTCGADRPGPGVSESAACTAPSAGDPAASHPTRPTTEGRAYRDPQKRLPEVYVDVLTQVLAFADPAITEAAQAQSGAQTTPPGSNRHRPVSYTHLTLPTIYSV